MDPNVSSPTIKDEDLQLLRRSEIRYRRLFEAARDGILIVDPLTRKITDANPFMSELLGYPLSELLGKELWEIGLLKDELASRSAFQELQRNDYIRYENLPLQNKKGDRHDVEFVSNVYDEDGQKVIQCNIRDITERKRMTYAPPKKNWPPMSRRSKHWSGNEPQHFARQSVRLKHSHTVYRMTCALRCGPCKGLPRLS
jgi:PAS domain S-box-containing protein